MGKPIQALIDQARNHLTQKEAREAFTYDAESGNFIRNYGPKRGVVIWSVNQDGYLAIGYKKKSYLAHRLAWLYLYGEIPRHQIDHINGVKTDNRAANLRLADMTQQQGNIRRYRSNTSGYRGVTKAGKNRWRAMLHVENQKCRYGGVFKTPAEAAMAYDRMAAEHFGSFYTPQVPSPRL